MLLQIKLPGSQFSNPWTDVPVRSVTERASSSFTLAFLEDIFYRKYPRLRRLKLSNFKSLEQLAFALDQDMEHAFYTLTCTDKAFGIEFADFILVHPDGMIRAIERRAKKLGKQALKSWTSEE